MGSSLTSSSHLLGEVGENIGQTLDLAHWSTWASLDNTGAWREGCCPQPLSLSVTHWTPLAENLGSEEDKKGRKGFPCASSWDCPQLWPPSSIL